MTGYERFRRKHLLTQSELAAILGITPQAVGKWETCAGTPTVGMLIKLSRLFNVSMEELTRTDYPENDFKELLANLTATEVVDPATPT